MSAVVEAWAQIETWLGRHAPVSAAALAPPADPIDIAAAQVTLGLAFPAELVESLRCHNGLLRWADILPDMPPLSVAGIVEHWERCMDVVDDFDGLRPANPGDEPWWHELWLPFAGADGDAQVIDMRPGPECGRLGWATHDGGAEFGGGWPSLGAYLAEAAEALVKGGGVDGWYPYLTGNSELRWGLANQTEFHGESLWPAPAG